MAKAPEKKATKKKTFKKKEKKIVSTGLVHVQASFNNTIVSITDQKGQVFGIARVSRIQERNSVCRAAGILDGRQQGQGIRAAVGGS